MCVCGYFLFLLFFQIVHNYLRFCKQKQHVIVNDIDINVLIYYEYSPSTIVIIVMWLFKR